MATRKIEYVALDDLVPADRNAKGHSAEVIEASITRFGMIEPAGVLDERTGRLVGGHGRREDLIARRDAGEPPPDGIVTRAGKWLVPVVRGWASADDAEAEAAALALNQSTIVGGWDDATLAATLAGLAASQQGFDGTGFVQANLDDLLMVLGPPPTLHELEREHGSLTGRELWPVLRFTVSPATKALWDKLCASIDSTDEDEIIATVVQRAS